MSRALSNHRAACMGVGLCLSIAILVAGLSITMPSFCEDPLRFQEAGSPPRRTWTEVCQETNRAFETCENLARELPDVIKSRHRFNSSSGRQLIPDDCVLTFECARQVDGQPYHPVEVLRIRIERTFSFRTGRATTFRIIRYRVRDEGELMLAAMVAYFKQHQLPYEVVDGKPPGKKTDVEPKSSAAF